MRMIFRLPVAFAHSSHNSLNLFIKFRIPYCSLALLGLAQYLVQVEFSFDDMWPVLAHDLADSGSLIHQFFTSTNSALLFVRHCAKLHTGSQTIIQYPPGFVHILFHYYSPSRRGAKGL